VDLNKNYSYLKNLCLIYKKGAQIFLEYIDELAQGYSFPFSWDVKQDLSKRTYYRTPTYQEVNQMEDLGIQLFYYSEFCEILAYYYLEKTVETFQLV
ncbi:hypothetical protein, partial [Moorena sp. SIO3B2]